MTDVLAAQELIDKLQTCKPETPVCLMFERIGPFFLAQGAWSSPSKLGDVGEIFLLSSFEPKQPETK